MAPDLAAQIMAHAWANADFAAALRGADPYGAIRAVLGVVVPPGTPLPEIPATPAVAEEGLDVRTGIRAGFDWSELWGYGR